MNKTLYELIENAQNNNNNALYTVIQNFSPTIKKFSKKLNYEEAETDLTIFLITLIKKMNLSYFYLKGDGVLVNYIHSAIKNKYIDIYRKNKNQNNVQVELIANLLEDKSNYNFDETVIMKMLLADLTNTEKAVIIGLYYCGNKYGDIAKKLKLSRQSIYNIKNKALNKIKQKLETC